MSTSSTNKVPRHRSRGRPWIWVAILALALVGAGAWWWFGRGAAVSDTVEAQLIPIAPQTYRVTVAGPGSLEAARKLEVASPLGLSGTIASIVAVGDRVTAGQTLAHLDPTPFERAVRDAEFALERAQSQLKSLDANQADSAGSARQALADAEARVQNAQRAEERSLGELTLAQRLSDLGTESSDALVAAQDNYDDTATELASAQAALTNLRTSQELQASASTEDRLNAELTVAQAELDLDDALADLASLTVTAPFAGVVASVAVTVGSSASQQQVLLELIDDSELTLPVQVDETQIGRVEVGQTALVRLDALPDRTVAGVVTAIAPVARIESNIPIFDVTVTLPNQDLSVRPGMTAEADIVVREVQGAVSVPTAAVTSRGGEDVVMVQARDGTVSPRPVTIVDTVGFNSIVEGDLAEGEAVVLAAAAGVAATDAAGFGAGGFGAGGFGAGGLGGGRPGTGGLPTGIGGPGGPPF